MVLIGCPTGEVFSADQAIHQRCVEVAQMVYRQDVGTMRREILESLNVSLG